MHILGILKGRIFAMYCDGKLVMFYKWLPWQLCVAFEVMPLIHIFAHFMPMHSLSYEYSLFVVSVCRLMSSLTFRQNITMYRFSLCNHRTRCLDTCLKWLH